MFNAYVCRLASRLLTMRVASWDEFAQKAKKMYLEEPMRTRYLVRYNHDRSRLCVKVTDDVKVGSWEVIRQCTPMILSTFLDNCKMHLNGNKYSVHGFQCRLKH